MSSLNKVMGSPLGARMVVNGRPVDYYCGTSYYALHGDRRVIQAACEAVKEYGMGPATKMDSPVLSEVRERAADYFGVEDVEYIVSGYLSDLVLLQALQDDYDLVIVDEISHYSVFDGLRSTGTRIITFRHRDPDDLSAKLRENVGAGDVPLIVSDGVFPITGAIAPLRDYADVMAGYDGALLAVDDSHGVGVIGETGRGTFEYWGLTREAGYFTGTFSKAFGGLGGFVPGDHRLMEKVRHNAKVSDGASPPSTADAAAAAMGLKILSEHPEMRRQLWENVSYLRRGLKEMGVVTEDTPVPIISLQLPEVDLMGVHAGLNEKDIVVAYIPPRGYSDAPDIESLKITLFSTHTREQLGRLLDVLRRLL